MRSILWYRLKNLTHEEKTSYKFETTIWGDLKDPPPFYYGGGGGGKWRNFFSFQNAKSRDWSVVGSSNLFWHTIWTHPALLGCAPRRKVCAPMRHTRLKKNGRKCPFLGQNGDGCAWCPQIMWGAPAPPECVKQGLESKRMVYTPS